MKKIGSVPMASVWILAVGLCSSIAIYLAAAPAADNSTDYDSLNQKANMRELEMLGGKVAILSLQIQQWFLSLWHGRSLAWTVAAISLFLALAVWFVAAHPPIEEEAEDKSKPEES